MRLFASAVVVLACSSARADDAKRAEVMTPVMAAIKARDAAAFATLVDVPFKVTPPYWRSKACNDQLHDVVYVREPKQMAVLVGCLAELDLQPTAINSQFWMAEPGMQVVFRFSLSTERPDGIQARREGDAPMIEIDELAKHVGGPLKEPADVAIKRATFVSDDIVAAADVIACFAPSGLVDTVRIIASNARLRPELASFPRLVESWAWTWNTRAKPLAVEGKPVRACVHEVMTYPHGRGLAVLSEIVPDDGSVLTISKHGVLLGRLALFHGQSKLVIASTSADAKQLEALWRSVVDGKTYIEVESHASTSTSTTTSTSTSTSTSKTTGGRGPLTTRHYKATDADYVEGVTRWLTYEQGSDGYDVK